MVDGIQAGSIAAGHHEFASLAKFVPELGVFNAPYVYRDGAHALRATDPASPVLAELNEKLVRGGGLRIIGRLYRGPRHITAKFPVRRPEDLRNRAFRAVPIDLWVSMVKGFGAVPTPVEVAELPTALMTGTVVGQENPLTMINANRLYEVQSQVSLTGHMLSLLAVFAHERTWQRLPAEEREAISAALAEKAQESLGWAEAADRALVAECRAGDRPAPARGDRAQRGQGDLHRPGPHHHGGRGRPGGPPRRAAGHSDRQPHGSREPLHPEPGRPARLCREGGLRVEPACSG
jgi:TRAP-type C4-dicarboxylate transport system substrate-binding protein